MVIHTIHTLNETHSDAGCNWREIQPKFISHRVRKKIKSKHKDTQKFSVLESMYLSVGDSYSSLNTHFYMYLVAICTMVVAIFFFYFSILSYIKRRRLKLRWENEKKKHFFRSGSVSRKIGFSSGQNLVEKNNYEMVISTMEHLSTENFFFDRSISFSDYFDQHLFFFLFAVIQNYFLFLFFFERCTVCVPHWNICFFPRSDFGILVSFQRRPI